MYAQFFGNYLLSHGITKEQLMHAMQEANNEHPKLGTLAMHAGYMSASEVDRVIIMQTHEDNNDSSIWIKISNLMYDSIAIFDRHNDVKKYKRRGFLFVNINSILSVCSL